VVTFSIEEAEEGKLRDTLRQVFNGRACYTEA
jgi:hypothetical protein